MDKDVALAYMGLRPHSPHEDSSDPHWAQDSAPVPPTATTARLPEENGSANEAQYAILPCLIYDTRKQSERSNLQVGCVSEVGMPRANLVSVVDEMLGQECL